MKYKVRTGELEDVKALVNLYKKVSEQSGTLARRADEVTEEWVQSFIEKSISSGLQLVVEHPDEHGRLIAEIHAYSPQVGIFRHLFTNLTILVDPEFQQKKIGHTIFTIFQEEIAVNRPDIGRVELFAKESNTKAISFYQKLGFRIEGRMEMRVKNPDGSYEADIPMAWQNPNFEFD